VVSSILLRLYDLPLKRYCYPCPHHTGIWGQQRHSSTHSQPQHDMEVSGQLHALAAISLVACMNLELSGSGSQQYDMVLQWLQTGLKIHALTWVRQLVHDCSVQSLSESCVSLSPYTRLCMLTPHAEEDTLIIIKTALLFNYIQKYIYVQNKEWNVQH